MNYKLVRFTKVLLDVMYYLGMIVTVSIPVMFHYVGRVIESFQRYYVPQCALYMLSGAFCLKIVYELRKMFITVLKEDAFVEENVNSLKVMGKCGFVTALLSIIRFPIASTPATVVVIIVFSIAGLFSTVLCQVFEKAIQFKLENDLTI